MKMIYRVNTLKMSRNFGGSNYKSRSWTNRTWGRNFSNNRNWSWSRSWSRNWSLNWSWSETL